MLQYVNPFLKICNTFLRFVLKERKRQVDKADLVGYLHLRVFVRQYDVRTEFRYLIRTWHVVHKTYCVNRQELVGVFAFCATLVHLVKDATACVADGAVKEVRLPSVLHLYDKAFAGVRLAVDIADNAALVFRWRQQFLVAEREVFDMQLVYEQVVEETYQQRLAELLSKQSFESPVGERIDVFAHSPMYCLHCKYTTKLCNDKEIDALFAISGGAVVSTAPTKQRTHPNLLCASVQSVGGHSQFGWCSCGQLHPPEALPFTAYRKCCYRVPKLLLPQCCKGVTALW